jgi:inhibitor of KinA
MKLEPLGDSAVVATLGTRIDTATLASVLGFAASVAAARGKGIVDVVPAYATVTVFYDPAQFTEAGEDAYDEVRRLLEACAMRGRAADHAPAGRTVEIPVCYGGEMGPDVGAVAASAGMGPDEVAARHAASDYLVYAIGFTPGFPFLGGLPEALATPRRATPRARVPAGSVGIGGPQTGVYPIASPGGWQLIGRTPLALFEAAREPAALLRPGDAVRFRAITQREFQEWR